MPAFTARVFVLAAAFALASCQSAPTTPAKPAAQATPATPPTPATPATPAQPATPAAPAQAHHDEPIHNIHKFTDRLMSGSGPETPEAFDQLKSMGIKTIISVDGSSPKVELADARGMRYVHIPTTYATITDEQRLEIARAIRDLPGPVFLHCHHGKHRGPSALAAAAVALGKVSNEEATAFIKKAGTAPNYVGLYECVAAAPVATKEELDAASNAFPKVRKAHGTTAAMVEVDLAWEHIGAIKAAGWKTPADSPDLVPAAEAGRLADNFRICHEDQEYIKAGVGMPPDYSDRMAAAMKKSSELEELIVKNAAKPELDTAFKAIAGSCKECHGYYRDRVRK